MRLPKDSQKNNNKEESPSFKPLTEGLGLNHFVDGLPYTPTNRKKMVHFSFPPPRAPQHQQKISIPVTPSPRLSSAIAQASTVSESIIVEKDSFLPPEPAPILVRFMAFWIDLAIAVACFVGIMYIAFSINGINLASVLVDDEGKSLYLPLLLMLFVVVMSYFLVLEFSWRKTIGKAIFGLRIESESGFQLITRTALFLSSFLILGLGFFAGFFDSRKRCWHDKFSHCEVVKQTS